MFPNRGQLTANSDRWGASPIGAYSIRYRQVQENFAKELEERKKEEKKRISERFRLVITVNSDYLGHSVECV